MRLQIQAMSSVGRGLLLDECLIIHRRVLIGCARGIPEEEGEEEAGQQPHYSETDATHQWSPRYCRFEAIVGRAHGSHKRQKSECCGFTQASRSRVFVLSSGIHGAIVGTFDNDSAEA